MRLFLLSNSTQFGGGYLEHCADALRAFVGPSVRRVLFVPYALHDRAGYTAVVRRRFGELGFAIDAVQEASDGPVQAINQAEAVFVGGGNTFRLIDALWRNGLVDALRRRVLTGAPYVGVSAGTNVACPSMRTTNDMPIVEPPTFSALNLLPFNINPHFQDPDPQSTHMGETREQRIAEFHEENMPPVVGLREGAWLEIEAGAVRLQGMRGARVFQRGEGPQEFLPGSRLDFLMAGSAPHDRATSPHP